MGALLGIQSAVERYERLPRPLVTGCITPHCRLRMSIRQARHIHAGPACRSPVRLKAPGTKVHSARWEWDNRLCGMHVLVGSSCLRSTSPTGTLCRTESGMNFPLLTGAATGCSRTGGSTDKLTRKATVHDDLNNESR